MQFTAKVYINNKAITERIEKAVTGTQGVLDAQVMKDSNKYCPMDTGMLQKSVITNSVLGSGLLTWSTPYAHKLYYDENINISRQRNPFAQRKWFEAAKSKNIKTWEKIINGEFSKNFK